MKRGVQVNGTGGDDARRLGDSGPVGLRVEGTALAHKGVNAGEIGGPKLGNYLRFVALAQRWQNKQRVLRQIGCRQGGLVENVVTQRTTEVGVQRFTHIGDFPSGGAVGWIANSRAKNSDAGTLSIKGKGWGNGQGRGHDGTGKACGGNALGGNDGAGIIGRAIVRKSLLRPMGAPACTDVAKDRAIGGAQAALVGAEGDDGGDTRRGEQRGHRRKQQGDEHQREEVSATHTNVPSRFG